MADTAKNFLKANIAIILFVKELFYRAVLPPLIPSLEKQTRIKHRIGRKLAAGGHGSPSLVVALIAIEVINHDLKMYDITDLGGSVKAKLTQHKGHFAGVPFFGFFER